MQALETIPGPLTGRCLCGAVTLAARELSPQCHVCHCDMCRRWNGGPSLTVVAKSAVFEGEEYITVYDSSEWAQRAFCARCGSHLYYRFNQSPDWYLWAGLFDDQSRFTIAQEIYIDRKPAGYTFAGEHPRLTEDEFLRSIGLK